MIELQMIGYGWAGILRRYLVDPVEMWWPANLAQVSLFRFILPHFFNITFSLLDWFSLSSHQTTENHLIKENLHNNCTRGIVRKQLLYYTIN